MRWAPSGDGRTGVGEEEPECDDAGTEAEKCADPHPASSEHE